MLQVLEFTCKKADVENVEMITREELMFAVVYSPPFLSLVRACVHVVQKLFWSVEPDDLQ